MEKKVITLNVDTAQAQKAMQDLGGTFEDVYGDIQPLSGRMGELEDRLYELALAGKQNTDEYKALLSEVGKYKNIIQQTDIVVDGMAQTTSQKMGAALETVTGAFAIGQGAIGLFGSESEELEKTMLKVQSATALVTGVMAIQESWAKTLSIRTAILSAAQKAWAVVQGVLSGAINIGTVAMKAFNAVVNANPIMLLITGISAVVGAFALFGDETESAKEKTDKLNQSIKDQIDLLDKQFNKLKDDNGKKIALMEAEGASDRKLYEEKRKNRRLEINDREGQIIQIKGFLKQQQDDYNKAREEEDFERAKSIADEIKANKDKLAQLRKDNKDAYHDAKIARINEADRIKKENEENLQKQKDAQAKQREAYKQHLAEMEAIRKRVESLRAELIENEADRLFEQERIRYKNEIATAKGNKELLELLEKQHLNNMTKIAEDDLAKKAEIRAREKAEEQKRVDDYNNLALATISIYEMVDVQSEEFSAKEVRRMENEAKWKALSEQQKYDAVYGTLQAISSITELFAQGSEEQQRKAFKVQKGVSTALAIVDTYRAANAAFQSMAAIPVVGSVLGAIAAAGAVAAGIVNVKKIQAQKFEGGSASGGGGGSAPSISASALTQAPTFTLQGSSGINQLQNTVQGQAPIKAYVVGSEVTTQQSLDRNLLSQAVF